MFGFGNTKFDYIRGRLECLDREEAKDKLELLRLGSDVRSLEDRLNRLLRHLNLEDKWLGSQIVKKEEGT